MFLTSDELIELTGYRFASYQKKWLIANGFNFLISRAGQPKVLRSVLIEKIGVDQPGRSVKPNYGFLEQVKKRETRRRAPVVSIKEQDQ